ncbi:hypothetical protein HpCK26_05240 [Helicobacter pylori]
MKIKAIIMGLLVSGALSLVHADTKTKQQYYDALLDSTDLDFSKRENAKSLAMWIFDIQDSISQLNKNQKDLIEVVDYLEKEVAKLKQQLRKQNQAKK